MLIARSPGLNRLLLVAAFLLFTIGPPFSLAANITVTTSPAGLQISVDGTAYTAPHTFSWETGTQHLISVSSPQTSPGTRRVFSAWSDGGAMTHSITAGSSEMTYTANFVTQFLLTRSVVPAAAGTIDASPSSADGYYNSGTSVQLTAEPAATYGFASWSGDLAGSANPATITVSAPRSVTANFGPGTNITIDTNPAGLQVSVDGVSYTAPRTINWTAGTQHTIAAPTPQGSGPFRRVFAFWSDGGAQTHTITVPGSPATYTAAFTTQYLLTVAASPSGGGSVTAIPSSADGYYNAGTVVQLTAYPATDYTFTGWTGDETGTTNPITVTMSAGRSVTATYSKTSGVEDRETVVPRHCDLLPNFPNPFNPSTGIRFLLAESRQIRLEVFDLLGRRIATLVDGEVGAGNHEVRFEAGSIPSGVYLCRLKAGEFVKVRRLVVSK